MTILCRFKNSAKAWHVFAGTLASPELAIPIESQAIDPGAINSKTTLLFPGVTIEFFSDHGVRMYRG